MFSVSFVCVASGSRDMRACRADSESVRKAAFLGFSSHKLMVSVAALGLRFCDLNTVSHQVLLQRMEVCLDA